MRRFYFYLFVLLSFISCEQSNIFKPDVSCLYPPNYGIAYVTERLGQYKLVIIDFYQKDTVEQSISGFRKGSLFYSPTYDGFGLIDSNLYFILYSHSGNLLFAVALSDTLSEVKYNSNGDLLVGVIQGKDTSRFVGMGIGKNRVIFSNKLVDCQFVGSTSCFDPYSRTYYIQAKLRDTLRIIGLSADTGDVVSTVQFADQLLDVSFDLNYQRILGLFQSGQIVKLLTIDPLTGKTLKSVVLPIERAYLYAGDYDASRQYYVTVKYTDTTTNVMFFNIQAGTLAELHPIGRDTVLQLVTWSALSRD